MDLKHFRAVTEQENWATYSVTLHQSSKLSPDTVRDFGTHWIEAGHRVREQVANDKSLVTFLRLILPPYEGGSVVLYRGESLGRWNNRNIGFAWTPEDDQARMFGRGLNAFHSGGILLKATVQPKSIISGPNSHSTYLQENQFTVDPFSLEGITEVERYPATLQA